MRPSRAVAAVAVVLAAALAVACATGRRDPYLGVHSLDATVVERQYDPPGSGGASYAGTGNYYLVFEGKEGDATSHYRLRVTQQQYIRFPEGTHVQIVVVDGNLKQIRRLP
ncbi:MAG TPA: hypothetical protein VGQ75_00225 [Thermoanaerobaculia bacterium]|nr:hypothetical protein [Thermoanaerobaculia bacterium]